MKEVPTRGKIQPDTGRSRRLLQHRRRRGYEKLSNDENCPFVLWVGSKRLIKRKLFDKYIEECYSI